MIGASFRPFARTIASRAPSRITRYDVFPDDMFRIQNGPQVRLREEETQQHRGRISYDIRVHKDGLVHPAVGDVYQGPNGCSDRPLCMYLLDLAQYFDETKTVAYRVPKGVQLPPRLVLLHEHTNHHALQCAVPMKLTG
ncbi:hypothetical protein DACRYDRAFT_22570 [Dacryopinax primogenitus]|uniref:Tse2 ADP-ribosyltransferase toxin domain-containing protein n=1 Tax=Dacryopinax primogenitus (strain DJM 731) TaxID=1858805 RepID=M5FUK1_DACPD|nr:uncharacterized protein DACRYDRAFT_22570 [Dacryopinax primogenitus]EJU01431.1 hypothetical protein DACRYDRAFT_22570 [Dacryopinax primogenitus]